MNATTVARKLTLALAAAAAPLPLALALWVVQPQAALLVLGVALLVAALAVFALLRSMRIGLDSVFAGAEDARRLIAASRDEVRLAAGTIGAEADSVARGNRHLSERTEAQASAFGQAAASMEELGASVKRNTESARATQGIAQRAGEATGKAIDAATQVIARMESIREATAKVADIVGMIDSIAFQTNILALNAAVEAARAGEQGRGFAVVATEVRSLSQRAAGSAREIKDLVASAASQVAESSEVVDQVAEAIAEINGRVAEVNELMNAVVAAGAEQSAGIVQVGRTIQEMERATQQNAALVGQVGNATESLSAQAARLAALAEGAGSASHGAHVSRPGTRAGGRPLRPAVIGIESK